MKEWVKYFWKELSIGLMIAIPATFIIMTAILIALGEVNGVELGWIKWF